MSATQALISIDGAGAQLTMNVNTQASSTPKPKEQRKEEPRLCVGFTWVHPHATEARPSHQVDTSSPMILVIFNAYLGKDERNAPSDGLGSVEDRLLGEKQYLTTYSIICHGTVPNRVAGKRSGRSSA